MVPKKQEKYIVDHPITMWKAEGYFTKLPKALGGEPPVG